VSTIDAKALRQISADDSAALPVDTVADLSPTTDSATGVDLQLQVSLHETSSLFTLCSSPVSNAAVHLTLLLSLRLFPVPAI